MNVQLDHAIRSAVADIVAATPEPGEAPAPIQTMHREHSSRRWIAVAAGLILIAGTAGLAALGNRDQQTKPASIPTLGPDGATPNAASRDLATASEIGLDDWVVPIDLSEIGDLQYAAIEPGAGFRSVHYGPIGDPARLDISIGFGNISSITTGGPIDVNGVEWTEVDESGFWGAERRIGDATVIVSSNALEPEQGRQILGGLLVVPSSELPSEPLDGRALGDSQTAPVATFTTDTRTFSLRAAQQNGYYCMFTDDGTGGRGGGCGQLFDPATTWASDALPGSGYTDDAEAMTVEASGIVAPDVAVLEIEFINDTIIKVAPTDLTGTFPARFWIAGATVELEPGQDPSKIPNVLIEVRGLDDAGNVLFTQTPMSGPATR